MSRTNLKRYLMLLAAIGLVAIASGGGSGTFASFNAEVQNNGNVFATGALFLHDHPFGGNLCKSELNNTTNVNINCDVILDQTDAATNTTYHGKIAISNAGTINGNPLTLNVSCTNTQPAIATSHLAYGISGVATTLTVDGLQQPLIEGTNLKIGSDTFTVSTTTGTPTGTADSVPVTVNSDAQAISVGDPVELAAFGTGDFCGNSASNVDLTIQETTSSYATTTDSGCVYPGSGCTTTPGTLHGAGLSPINLSGALAAGETRYFVFSFTMPTHGSGTADNVLQNSEANFGLDWTVTQA